MPARGVVFIVMTALVIASPGDAVAEVVADANCPPPRDRKFGSLGSTDPSDRRIAQTFLAINTGAVVGAGIDISKGPDWEGNPATGDYYVQLLAVEPLAAAIPGRPSDTALATAHVPDSAVPAGDSMLSVVFPAPAVVRSGVPYALSVFRPATRQLEVGGRNHDPCFGAIWFRNSETGGRWTGGGFQDMVFETFVDTSVAPADMAAGPPGTAITARPGDVTRRKRSSFEFAASDPGSSFECRLDDRPFRACRSPATYRLAASRHTFAVRAIDPAGEIDPTPATHSWRVRKRK